MLEHMEIAEQVYKCGNNSKNTNRAETNRASYGKKHKRGEFASPNNTKKGHAVNPKSNYTVHPSDQPKGTKTCLVHGHRQSTEGCKILKEYPNKDVA